MKAFVAEESEKLRSLLVNLIKRFTGLTVSGAAGDVHEVIQSVRKLKPDVIILSMQLSNGTAMDVLKNIRVESSRPLVILLVDQIQTASHKLLEKYGIQKAFNKALELEELVKTLKKLSDDPPETSKPREVSGNHG